jgi:hypothetical protein
MENEGYRGEAGFLALEPILFGNDGGAERSGASGVEDQAGNSSMMKMGVRTHVPFLWVST